MRSLPYNPPTPLTPGTRIGVYDVTAPIGEGGMGQVFRATDTKLKRQVAIKILPPSLAADHDRLARFFLISTLLNEAAAPITLLQNWNPDAKR